MKFEVERARARVFWDDPEGAPCCGAVKGEDGKWAIEEASLEDLKAVAESPFAGKSTFDGHSLVINFDDGRLTIYDDYIE